VLARARQQLPAARVAPRVRLRLARGQPVIALHQQRRPTRPKLVRVARRGPLELVAAQEMRVEDCVRLTPDRVQPPPGLVDQTLLVQRRWQPAGQALCAGRRAVSRPWGGAFESASHPLAWFWSSVAPRGAHLVP